MALLAEMWSILTPWQRRGVVAMQAVSLVMAVSTATGIAAIAPFFAVLGDPRLIEHNALLHWLYARGGFVSQRGFVVALGIAFITLVLSANLINVLGFMAMNRLALRIGNELQTALFTEYLSRPYAFHTAANSTTLSGNIVYETNRITHGILQSAFVMLTNLVTAGLIVLSILLLKPALAIAIVLALAGGYSLIYLAVRNRLLRISYTQSSFANEQAQIVNESLGAIREIIILQVRDFFSGRFERASLGFLRCVADAQVVAQSPRYLMECVAAAGLVSVALVLANRGSGAGAWLGVLTFLAFAAYRLLPALHQVFTAIVSIRADRAALSVLAPDLRCARRGRRAALPAERGCSDPFWIARPRNEIRLQGVSYGHGRDRAWALHDVSLRIPARAAVGIVGANGAGKTTLLDLIAGLLTPAAGDIEIDGRLLDDDNRAAWQACIAYVPQHVFLSDSSIAQNIAFGVAAEAIDRPRLLEAARLAQLDEFVTTLARGYEQQVGDRGVALSGGQRQRVGIARALYRQASVLLLDEATSALDGFTEQELMITLRQLRGRYTVVLIAHGMSAVRACDLIFHLEQGRIVASGTYEGLLNSSAVFRRMTGAG